MKSNRSLESAERHNLILIAEGRSCQTLLQKLSKAKRTEFKNYYLQQLHHQYNILGNIIF